MFSVRFLTPGTTVAAKTLHILRDPENFFADASDVETAVKELEREIELQSKLFHPNLVRFIGAVFDENNLPVWLVSEYVAGGSLEKLIKSFGSEPIPHQVIIYIFLVTFFQLYFICMNMLKLFIEM